MAPANFIYALNCTSGCRRQNIADGKCTLDYSPGVTKAKKSPTKMRPELYLKVSTVEWRPRILSMP